MRRRKLSRRSSRRIFRKSASRLHKRNFAGAGYVMRGGIRL